MTGNDLTCTRPLLCKSAWPLARMSSWKVKPFLLIFCSCVFSLFRVIAWVAILQRANLSLTVVGPEREKRERERKEREGEKRESKHVSTIRRTSKDWRSSKPRVAITILVAHALRFCWFYDRDLWRNIGITQEHTSMRMRISWISLRINIIKNSNNFKLIFVN